MYATPGIDAATKIAVGIRTNRKVFGTSTARVRATMTEASSGESNPSYPTLITIRTR
jgi:hypothetical protein